MPPHPPARVEHRRLINKDDQPGFSGMDMAPAATFFHSRSSSSSATASTHNSAPNSPPLWGNARVNRNPSITSSLSSSPPRHSFHNGKLSAEKPLPSEPYEMDEDSFDRIRYYESCHLPDISPMHCRSRPHTSGTHIRSSDEQSDRGGLVSEGHRQFAKRQRKSGDSSWNSLASGITTRFTSLSRPPNKPSLGSDPLGDRRHESWQSPSSPPMFLMPHSRSHSFGGLSASERRERSADSRLIISPPIETIMEIDGCDSTSWQMETYLPDTSLLPPFEENEPRSPTPLLPMTNAAQPNLPVYSPLQAPPVAGSNGQVTSSTSTSQDGRSSSGLASPPLSRPPSTGSLPRSRPNTADAGSNTLSLIMTDPDDEWAEVLGHANFTIKPEPYVPANCSEQSYCQLVQDWEKARNEYAKHLARTKTYFGGTSRTYKLTEQKWASIESRWRDCKDTVSQRAVESGALSYPSPVEPEQAVKIPAIDDPRFLLGDDIVGVMRRESPPASLGRQSSKKAQLMKMLGSSKRL